MAYKVQKQRKKERIARAKEYLALVNKGKSMAEIGRLQNPPISRQRVRTLIQSLSSASA